MASPEEEKEPTIGWFSASAAEEYGTVVWEDDAGREVICTQVGRALDEGRRSDSFVVSTTLRRYVRGKLRIRRFGPGAIP